MTYETIGKPVESHLERFNGYFKESLKSSVPLLDIVVRYILKQRGKRVRPTLVFLCADLCGGVNQRTYIGASMVELLHTATLVHDDVVDEAKERRGLASINAVWKNKVAVLVGDFLLSRGLLAAVENNETDFLRFTSEAVKRMSEGELLQIQKSRQYAMSEETYFQIISDKTASLLSTCCQIGASSATDDRTRWQILREYGENVGLAFQIRDDVLDYTSRSAIIGKPVLNDLRDRKITLPLIYACRKLDSSRARKVVSRVKSGRLKEAELQEIAQLVQSNGGIDLAQQKAQELADKAIGLLGAFSSSETKDSLVSFAHFVVSRTK